MYVQVGRRRKIRELEIKRWAGGQGEALGGSRALLSISKQQGLVQCTYVYPEYSEIAVKVQ